MNPKTEFTGYVTGLFNATASSSRQKQPLFRRAVQGYFCFLYESMSVLLYKTLLNLSLKLY